MAPALFRVASGIGTLVRMSQESDEAEEMREKHFLLNLQRLSGKTSSITPECIMEILFHIHNQSIREVQFIEDEYLDVVFGDDEFMSIFGVSICSVEVLISSYEKAKRDNNEVVLGAFRIIHLKGRIFLDDGEVKQKIANFIIAREVEVKRQYYYKMVGTMISYMRRFGTEHTAGRTVSDFFQSITSTRAIQSVDPHSEVVAHSSTSPIRDVAGVGGITSSEL